MINYIPKLVYILVVFVDIVGPGLKVKIVTVVQLVLLSRILLIRFGVWSGNYQYHPRKR